MRKFIAIAIAAFFIAPALAEGEVYRWKDPNGVWHYSDQPQPGAELVKRPGARSSSSNSPSAPSFTPPPAPTDNGLPPLSPEVTQQVRQDAAKAQVDQCKKATEEYTKTIQARRLYKEDAKGNRTFLSGAEIDAARLEARRTKDIACGSGQ